MQTEGCPGMREMCNDRRLWPCIPGPTNAGGLVSFPALPGTNHSGLGTTILMTTFSFNCHRSPASRPSHPQEPM
ncbi:rCG30355, partial [Rattus norvegicus]